MLLPDFSDLHILVVGDVMIDRYISGHINRISPEAPVPVLEMEKTENRPGGAANVALNVSSLGAKVTIISVTGEDDDADVLKILLSEKAVINCHFMKVQGRKTTVKTRIMSGAQHILRLDNEDTYDISSSTEQDILLQVRQIVSDNKVDGVILQDYNKGLLTKNLITELISMCNEYNAPTFIDPKEKNFFSYRNCTFFKPNLKEITKSVKTDHADLDGMDKELRSALNHKISFITLGAEGIYIHDGQEGEIVPTRNRSISDVCGAGDTVLSVASLCYLKGLDIRDIARISNIAGGQVCEVPGVIPVDKFKLAFELSNV